jgi:hypothetical protein
VSLHPVAFNSTALHVGFCRWPAALCVLLALWAGAALAQAPELNAQDGAEADQAFEQALKELQLEQWGQAELYLERSLMHNADHAEARLQLALLLARRGQLDAARALIESLIDDPRTPAGHRERLQTLLASSMPLALPPPPARLPAQTKAEITIGYTRNPYARSSLDELTLTLAQGSITLPVARNDQPAGTVSLALRHVVQDQWGLEVNQQKWGGSEGRSAGSLLVFGAGTVAGQGVQWSALALRSLDDTTRQAVGLSIPHQAWRFTAGLFNESALERRGYTLRFDRALAMPPSLQFVGYAELERATAGKSSLARAGILAEWAVAPSWVVSGQATLHRDLQGYSPLLESNAPRKMLAAYLALERHWEPAPRWRIAGRVHAAQRWSNISLFEYRDAGVQLSLQRLWP